MVNNTDARLLVEHLLQMHEALFEVLDALGVMSSASYELDGYGISASRAEEIFQLAKGLKE